MGSEAIGTISWAALTGAKTLTVTKVKVVILAILVRVIVGLKVTSH